MNYFKHASKVFFKVEKGPKFTLKCKDTLRRFFEYRKKLFNIQQTLQGTKLASNALTVKFRGGVDFEAPEVVRTKPVPGQDSSNAALKSTLVIPPGLAGASLPIKFADLVSPSPMNASVQCMHHKIKVHGRQRAPRTCTKCGLWQSEIIRTASRIQI